MSSEIIIIGGPAYASDDLCPPAAVDASRLPQSAVPFEFDPEPFPFGIEPPHDVNGVRPAGADSVRFLRTNFKPRSELEWQLWADAPFFLLGRNRLSTSEEYPYIVDVFSDGHFFTLPAMEEEIFRTGADEIAATKSSLDEAIDRVEGMIAKRRGWRDLS